MENSQEIYAKVNPASINPPDGTCIIPASYKGYIVTGLVFTILVVILLVAALIWALTTKKHTTRHCKDCRKKCCPK